jgi:hypothetical protein
MQLCVRLGACWVPEYHFFLPNAARTHAHGALLTTPRGTLGPGVQWPKNTGAEMAWSSSGSTTLFIKRVAFATPIVFTFHQVRRCSAACSLPRLVFILASALMTWGCVCDVCGARCAVRLHSCKGVGNVDAANSQRSRVSTACAFLP